MTHYRISVLSVLCLLLAVHAQPSQASPASPVWVDPPPTCKAVGCNCDDYNDPTTACLPACNFEPCTWHNSRCKCNPKIGTDVSIPNANLDANCTDTKIGGTCTFTCSTGFIGVGSLTVKCAPSYTGGSAPGGLWSSPGGACVKQCTTQPPVAGLDKIQNVTDCPVPANPNTTCSNYECKVDENKYKKVPDSWRCKADGTWENVGVFCSPTVCTTQPTDIATSTTFYCKYVSKDTPANEGNICPYECQPGYRTNGTVVCRGGGWVNTNTVCVPSCGAVDATTQLNGGPKSIRKGCVRTVATYAGDTSATPFPLNAVNGDQCQFQCNTGFNGQADPTLPGGIQDTDGLLTPGEVWTEPLEAPCAQTFKCGATAGTLPTATNSFTWAVSNVQNQVNCFASCDVGDLKSNFVRAEGDTTSSFYSDGLVWCAYIDEVDGNTYYFTPKSKQPAQYWRGQLVPHGWQCDLRCPPGYTKSGPLGPYCYNGAWRNSDRRGNPITENGWTTPVCTQLKGANPNGPVNIITTSCSQKQLNDKMAGFINSTGKVQVTDCPFTTDGTGGNTSTLLYPHLRTFLLACPVSGYELSGPTYVQCVSGQWYWGGQTINQATNQPKCVPQNGTTIRACPTLNSTTVPNADASLNCSGVLPGGRCTISCANGYAPKYLNVKADNTSTLDAAYWWWQKGIKCMSAEQPFWDTNWDLTRVCVDTCRGYKQANGAFATTGGCDNPTVGCDYFCNLNPQTTVDTLRDCTGIGCSRDGGACAPPTATLTLDILHVRVDIDVQGLLTSNAWAAVYRAGETSNYRFLAAAHLGGFGASNGASVNSGSKYTAVFDVNKDFYWWQGAPASWIAGRPTNNSKKFDLEVRVFPDLDVTSTTVPLATTAMCQNIACKNAPKPTEKRVHMEIAHVHPENVMGVLDVRREEQLLADVEALWNSNPFPNRRALPDGTKELRFGHPTVHHDDKRHVFVQGSLNANGAVIPTACLEQTNCTCEKFGNKVCDPECNHAVCSFDNFDCFCFDIPAGKGQSPGYATISCNAAAFGGGGNKNDTNDTKIWQFPIGAQCTLTCPQYSYAVNPEISTFDANPSSVIADSAVTVGCRRLRQTETVTNNGAIWNTVVCHSNCTNAVKQDLTNATVVAGFRGADACSAPDSPNVKYFGGKCNAWTCDDGFKPNPLASLYCGDPTPSNPSGSSWHEFPSGIPLCLPTAPAPGPPPTVANCSKAELSTLADITGVKIKDTNAACWTADSPPGTKCDFVCGLNGVGAGATAACALIAGKPMWSFGDIACSGFCPNAKETLFNVGDNFAANGDLPNDDVKFSNNNCSNGNVSAAGSATSCDMACANNYKLWNTDAKTYGNWKCAISEKCTSAKFDTSKGWYGFWALSPTTIGGKAGNGAVGGNGPQCYTPCNYANNPNMFNGTAPVANSNINDTTARIVPHGSVANQWVCPNGTVSSGGIAFPYCYRGLLIWVDLAGNSIDPATQFKCSPAPTPMAPAAPQQPQQPAAPLAPAPVQPDCDYAGLKAWNVSLFKLTGLAQAFVQYNAATSYACNQTYPVGKKVPVWYPACNLPADGICIGGTGPTGWNVTSPCTTVTCPALVIPNGASVGQCAGTTQGSMCEVQCAPGFTPRFATAPTGTNYDKSKKPNFWVLGAICDTGAWRNAPICVPKCEGWANTSDTNGLSTSTCDSTDAALCDWYCSKSNNPNTTNGLQCSAKACRDKGIEVQCSDPKVLVTIEPIAARLNWQFSRDVPQSAWIGFTYGPTTDQFEVARSIPKGTNLGGVQPKNNVLLYWRTADLPPSQFPATTIVKDVDWTLDFYQPLGEGDLTIKVWEDHSTTISGSVALATTTVCQSNIDCGTPAPAVKPVAAIPRPKKCENLGCDCSKIGDGVCDPNCNREECGFDGNDCGCKAPTPATVRSAIWPTTVCTPSRPLNGSNPPYKIGDSCDFACPDGWVIRDQNTGAVVPTLSQKTGAKVQCTADRFSLLGARWTSYVCEAPCLSPPPLTDWKKQLVKFDDSCTGAKSGSACSWSCVNGTDWTPDPSGATQGVDPTKRVLCVDGKWYGNNQAVIQCFPPCDVAFLLNTTDSKLLSPLNTTVATTPDPGNFTWSCTGIKKYNELCTPTCWNTTQKPSGGARCGWKYDANNGGWSGNWEVASIGEPKCTGPAVQQGANCSVNSLNALISNGVVFPTTDCGPASNIFVQSSDILVSPGTTCKWTCEPKYKKSGGDGSGLVTCNADGSWSPGGLSPNVPYCHPPCLSAPPVDGGKQCVSGSGANFTAVGETCSNWDCEPNYVRDECSGNALPRCYNPFCPGCLYPASDVPKTCGVGTGTCSLTNFKERSRRFREWKLDTSVSKLTFTYNLPYCFRPCRVSTILNTKGLMSCGDQNVTTGFLKHGTACDTPVCKPGFQKAKNLIVPLCYDGVFKGDSAPCEEIVTGCAAGADCCTTSDLQQLWNAQLSGDVNDPDVKGTCKDLWATGENVTFDCNKDPSVYKWYAPTTFGGSKDYELGDKQVIATCGVNKKWSYSYQGALLLTGLPKCLSQQGCKAITYNQQGRPDEGYMIYNNGQRSELNRGIDVAATNIICPASGPGSDCVIKCKPGYVVRWKAEVTPDYSKLIYGPVCNSDNNWVDLPICQPACEAAGCGQNVANYSTGCDHVCSEKIGNYQCSGPACNYDNNECKADRVIKDMAVRANGFYVSFISDKKLGTTAWIAAYHKETETKGGAPAHYRWVAAQTLPNPEPTIDGQWKYSTEFSTSDIQTLPNYYTSGDLEIRVYQDVLNADMGQLSTTTMCDYSAACKKQGFASDADAKDAGPWLILAIIFIVVTVILLIACIVLFMKVKAAASAGGGANYNEL